MRKPLLATLLILLPHFAFANKIDYSKFFKDKSACFILYNLNTNKIIAKYNPDHCAQRVSPCSTFKIPLSLMAFDQRMIDQKTIFKWDGKNKGLPQWNQNQTPHTWLKNSVVWVSQSLTPRLGLDKIQQYLREFNYGNQDFSGDPGKHNGLTQAWLVSSLKISPIEQLEFLKAFLTNGLPVSEGAIRNTRENMYLETSENGWKLYGKSGSGPISKTTNTGLSLGWLVGFTDKNNQIYIFVTHYNDTKKPKSLEAAGIVAKKITTQILKQQGAF